MKKWIILGVLAALCILFACLKSVWTGFIYLGIASLSLLCVYLVYLRIKLYKRDYYDNFQRAFVVYKADYVNSYNITAEEFENNLPIHMKEFKKLMRREKFVDIFKILAIIAFIVACIIGVINL